VSGLETVDLEGVEILARGGPFHGKGSPPEGDYLADADLDRYAANTNHLHGLHELTSPNKLGHSKDQELVADEFLPDDQLPALGWLTNLRRTSGKLVTDIKRVPKRFADLIEAGAFRPRSAELARVRASDGRSYDVVSGLSWLGAKQPAIKTLRDVFALYASDAEPLALIQPASLVPLRAYEYTPSPIQREEPTMRRFPYESAAERDRIRDVFGAELIDVPDPEDVTYVQYLRQLGDDPTEALRAMRGLLMTADAHGRYLAAAERMEERVFAAEREVAEAKELAEAREVAQYEAYCRAMGVSHGIGEGF
jgi:hypothetical protein